VPFAPGDRVHVPRLGTGVVREVRNRGRYLVEIKGKTMVVEGARVERADPGSTESRNQSTPHESDAIDRDASARTSIDLHGKTVEQALEALETFMNDALLASLEEVRIIHGRSGRRIRDAVHQRLRALPPVRSFRLDPRNPGVTIVVL
jgi:DNA mismatch repair protein MutS2